MFDSADYMEEMLAEDNAHFDRFDGWADPDDQEDWVDRMWGKHLDDCKESGDPVDLRLCPARIGLNGCKDCCVYADCPDRIAAEAHDAYYDEQSDRAAWANQLEWEGCAG